MTNKPSFKEIRQRMDEIIKRPPTDEQLKGLKTTFLEIEQPVPSHACSESKTCKCSISDLEPIDTLDLTVLQLKEALKTALKYPWCEPIYESCTDGLKDRMKIVKLLKDNNND